MEHEEILYELKLSYYELVDYLLKKYGPAKYDYFRTMELKSKNSKVTRTSEGLICHHIDEDKGGNLNNPDQAKNQPFEWQLKERLVYCNLLEHLILHIKIAVLRQRHKLYNVKDISDFFTTHGINTIVEQINDSFYRKGEFKQNYRIILHNEIKNNFDDYLMILKTLIWYIDSQFEGKRNQQILKEHNFVHVSIMKSLVKQIRFTCEIIKVDYAHNLLAFQVSNEKFKQELNKFADSVEDELGFEDSLNLIINDFSMNYEGQIMDEIRDELIDFTHDVHAEKLSGLLSVDFHGYGIKKYTNYLISEKRYGSFNLDQYISYAFPSESEVDVDMLNGNPEFWKGKLPKFILDKDYWFIVRVKVSFDIKNNEIPFMRYKKFNSIGFEHVPFDNENNLLNKKGVVLSTTKRYLEANDEFLERELEFTLTKEDYQLFIDRYDISYIEYLDGCYWK